MIGPVWTRRTDGVIYLMGGGSNKCAIKGLKRCLQVQNRNTLKKWTKSAKYREIKNVISGAFKVKSGRLEC